METQPDLSERLATILGDELEIERELGGGGMSRVFVAFDRPLQRRVVVKVLPDEIATVLSRERFRREILTSATLQHPNIVPVISAGDRGGLIHFIMPFVDGESLRGRLQREGALNAATVVSITRDVARALAYAHERGVVHRDIKPDNVLLSGGTAVVADFGVAKAFASAREGSGSHNVATLTNVGMSLGTPAYMAPEQVAGDTKLDARTDLYALGAMAYEALSGRPLFQRETVAAVLRAHLTDEPEPLRKLKPGIPGALEEAVLRCLSKDPKDRPQSASELLAILENPAVLSGAFSSESQIRSLGNIVAVPRKAWKVVVGLVVAVAAVAAAVTFLPAPGEKVAPVSARPALPTIAVLPLLSIAADSSSNYLAFGVTDEIINALTRIGGVRVTSRAAAQDAQRNSLSLTQLDSIGVTHALEGTIQKQGTEVHVAVRLVNTADGLTAWSEVFDGSINEIFDMQRYIAGAVAEAVRKDLAPRIDSTLGAGTFQPKPDAHDAYLRAHYELSRRGDGDLTTAVSQLRKAVGIDSQYAVAWAELAQALTILPLYGKGDPSALQPEAMRAAQRALAIDSTLAAAHAALGNLLNAQWRWQEGAVALRRAVALDPNYAPAHQWLGENRLLNGDLAEAERALAEAVRIDTTLSVTKAVHGLALALLKRPADADRDIASAIAMTPSVSALHLMKGAALLYTNREKEAIAALEVGRVIDPKSPLILGTLGYAYGKTGDRQKAADMERQLNALPSKVGVATAMAKIRLSVGDTASALDYLERALRERDPLFAAEPLRSPVYAPLHRSERFGRIVEAAGLDRQRVTAPGI